MKENGEHEGKACLFREQRKHESRVDKDISFRMPSRVLGAINQIEYLREMPQPTRCLEEL